jgi:nucleoside-diphosphate-sugar epimerase
MKILVTGASGFIGKNLLLKIGNSYDVFALYNSDIFFNEFLSSSNLNNVKPIKVNLIDVDEVKEFSKRNTHFDLCIFLAANGDPAKSAKMPAFDLLSNTMALINLLDAIKINKLIYFSSGAVYDGLKGYVNPSSRVNPILPYAISKFSSEKYVLFFKNIEKLDTFCIVRFFGAYGPHEATRKIYSKLVQKFAIEQECEFEIKGDGKNFIDAMYISDAVDAIQLLMFDNNPPPIVDLYSNSPLSIAELVKFSANLFGIDPLIKFSGDVPEYIEFRSNDQTLFSRYGFFPKVSLEVGLNRLYGHLLNNYKTT